MTLTDVEREADLTEGSWPIEASQWWNLIVKARRYYWLWKLIIIINVKGQWWPKPVIQLLYEEAEALIITMMTQWEEETVNGINCEESLLLLCNGQQCVIIIVLWTVTKYWY